MSKKLTKIDRYNAILAIPEVAGNDDLRSFVEHEIELLSKKNTEKKPTEKQKENEVLKTAILEALADGEKRTITEMIKTVDALADLTNQRVSALANQLVEANLLVKTVEKRVTYFALA